MFLRSHLHHLHPVPRPSRDPQVCNAAPLHKIPYFFKAYKHNCKHIEDKDLNMKTEGLPIDKKGRLQRLQAILLVPLSNILIFFLKPIHVCYDKKLYYSPSGQKKFPQR